MASLTTHKHNNYVKLEYAEFNCILNWDVITSEVLVGVLVEVFVNEYAAAGAGATR
jgi:hypothetical protein